MSTTTRPNVLFLMTDQMQGEVLRPGHVCRTPNLDRLAARGMRFDRAYTPNPICSPARASLMTGLLPHNHGVKTVTHTVDDDQSCLRLDKPHWAQRLAEAGYRTGYFGKWHVERSGQLERFGWQEVGDIAGKMKELRGEAPGGEFDLRMELEWPPGFGPALLYGVTSDPPVYRRMGAITELSSQFLDGALGGEKPWCCFVSTNEPHDPFICGREAFAQYEPSDLALPPAHRDGFEGRPNLYRKAARAFAGMSDREHREAAACYYASITELDEQFGRLLEKIDAAGELENTIVVMSSDHGELLGAHGLYCKNIGAYERAYRIPMLLAGPGVAAGQTSEARVGLHDVGPTLLEMAGLETIGAPDARSFAPVLGEPAKAAEYDRGFAEYAGGRVDLTQRVVWDGPWKLVFNGFDFDELYHLEDDPEEVRNLADDPAHAEVYEWMMRRMWERVAETGDHSLYRSGYPATRGVAGLGPGVAEQPLAT